MPDDVIMLRQFMLGLNPFLIIELTGLNGEDVKTELTFGGGMDRESALEVIATIAEQQPPAQADEPTPEHLIPTASDRGFAHLPRIQGGPGESVWVKESSAAMSPHLWLALKSPANRNEPEGVAVTAYAHMPVEAARQYAEQILQLCDQHYQLADN